MSELCAIHQYSTERENAADTSCVTSNGTYTSLDIKLLRKLGRVVWGHITRREQERDKAFQANEIYAGTFYVPSPSNDELLFTSLLQSPFMFVYYVSHAAPESTEMQPVR